MIGSLKDWFLDLSLRERVLIGILGLLIVVVAGFYGVVRPFWNALENAEDKYAEAVDRQGRIETKVAALTAPVDADVKPVTGRLETFVSQSAGEVGFAVGKMDPQPDGRVIMTVKSAKSTALFGWLSRLEARGVSVETLSVTPQENGTVSANITLKSSMP